MKFLSLLSLFVASLLYGASPEVPPEVPPEVAAPLDPQVETEEIAAFEPSLPQSVSLEPLQWPAPPIEPPHKSPFITMTLASLFPGLGHLYLGDMKTAWGLMGATSLGMGIALYPGTKEGVREAAALTFSNIAFYNMYAAYRDLRLYNGTSGYSYKMPTDSLADLTLAPFRWRVLKKPEVWGGFLGVLAVAGTLIYFTHETEGHTQLAASSHHEKSSVITAPYLALPIGIGEESFFRGFLQSAWSEKLTPWGGIVLSSLAFGAAHIPNAFEMSSKGRREYYKFSLPFITLFGMYQGWVTYKNHSIQESVALHTWYDFLLFMTAAAATQTASTGCMGCAFSVPF